MSTKIVWGFDAFEDGLRTNIFVGETLASLNEKLGGQVQPLFAIGSEAIDGAPALIADTLGGLTAAAESKMGQLLNKVHIPGILPPQVVLEHSFSRTKIVKKFINEAEKNGASLIVVGSHGRKGLERAVLGSFSETLLLQCHLPVLVVGQNFDQIPKWNEILFPTDFGDDSSFAFRKALDLAKRLSAKITLFHHFTPIIDPIIQSTIAPFGGVWISYRDEMNLLKEKRLETLEEWKKTAKEMGVDANSILDDGISDTSEAILSYANSNRVGLITMGAQSGSLATTLFGAISRKVIRQAQCPVWLLRRH